MGTRQPAIWMGESGSIAVAPGVLVSGPREVGPQPMRIPTDFEARGLPVVMKGAERSEVISPNYYNVLVDDLKGGSVLGEMSASEYLARANTYGSWLTNVCLFSFEGWTYSLYLPRSG